MIKTLSRLSLLIAGLLILVFLPYYLNQNPKADFSAPSNIQTVHQPESEARVKHIISLQKIWQAVLEDWKSDDSVRALPYSCRQYFKFKKTVYLYWAVTLSNVKDKDGMELTARPDHPGLNIDLRELEKARGSLAKIIISTLYEAFGDNVDEGKKTRDCDPQTGRPTKEMDLAGILYRITEVSMDAGLEGKEPSPEKVEKMLSFAIPEQVNKYKKGQKTLNEVRLFIEFFGHDPSGYIQ